MQSWPDALAAGRVSWTVSPPLPRRLAVYRNHQRSAAAPRVASPRYGERVHAGAPSGDTRLSGSRVRSGQCTEARGRHPASLPRRKAGTVQRRDVTLGVVAILVATVCVLLGR